MTLLVHRTIGLWPMPKSLLLKIENCLPASAMLKALRAGILIIVFLAPFFLPHPTLASQFIDAITSPDMNLQKFAVGGDLIDGTKAQGLMTITADGLTTMAMGARDKDGNIISQGATGTLFAYIDTMYKNPIISSTDYLAYLQQNSGLISSAYAQGKGADFLKPVLDLWIVSRNVAYLFFVVIFVAIGFMIMFRSKLNPQTAINIQLALPSIIVSLILVTFSFAICGLIVDLAYLGNDLIYNIFYTKFVVPGAIPPNTWSGDATPFELIKAANIGGNLDTALKAIAQVMSGGGPASLFNVIIAMTVVSTAFKIFFSLLTKYIALFLITFLSPFAILASALPGKSGGAANTFKQIFAASLVFPATLFMTNLSFYFSQYALVASADFQDLDPFQLTTFVSVANNQGVAVATISGLISLGVLMAAAQIPQVIDGILEVKPTLGAGTGEEIGGALRKIPIIGGMI